MGFVRLPLLCASRSAGNKIVFRVRAYGGEFGVASDCKAVDVYVLGDPSRITLERWRYWVLDRFFV